MSFPLLFEVRLPDRSVYIREAGDCLLTNVVQRDAECPPGTVELNKESIHTLLGLLEGL